MSSVQEGTAEHHGDEFKNVMFPDGEAWQQKPLRDYEGMLCYCRGDPMQDPFVLVCHGCPLSVAWCILRNGFTVGNGQHRKNGTARHGIVGISNGGLFERLLLARDRSTTNRDTEWKFGISGWSTPCVIAFPAACVAALGRIGECWKCCIEAPVGSSMQLPTDVMFCLMKPEYMRYRL